VALEVFNLNLSHGHLAVTAPRFAAFEAALKVATAEQCVGVLGYVGTVNADQRSLLAAGRNARLLNFARERQQPSSSASLVERTAPARGCKGIVSRDVV
jgi:hypothetical protein